MEDNQIIALYWNRSEQAIRETEKTYGAYCTSVSMNVLHNKQDAEECVNDTWLWTWNHIPPEKPLSLRAYLGCIVRHISLTRYRWLHAAKRNRNLEDALDEFSECIPAPEEAAESDTPLEILINDFLRTQSAIERNLFILRYFHSTPVKDIARLTGQRPQDVSSHLQTIRKRLRVYLTERGYRL